MAPTSIDGTEISGATIDGQDVSEITVDGETVFTAIPDSVVYDFETGDVSRWDDVNDLSAVTDRVYAGSYSGYCDTAQDGTYQARVIPSEYDGGQQPSTFQFYWQSTELGSFGAGIRLFNSNNNVEVGLANDNPAWIVDDGNGFENVYSGDGYDRWVRFKISFDWTNGTFSTDFEDLQSGSTYSDSGRPLKNGTNIEAIQIEDFNQDTWQDGGAIDEWFDNISLNA